MSENELPKATLDDVLVELKSLNAKKKDLWDQLTPALAILSSFILGCAGLWFTQSYNDRQAQVAERQSEQDHQTKKHQSRILEMQTVEKFLPYLTANNERQKEVALLVITTLGSPEFATQFAKLDPSTGTQAAAEGVSEILCVRREETFPRCGLPKVPLDRRRAARWESRGIILASGCLKA
ncbi:MAG: hypothetical protein Q7J42_07500, partial [Sulfuritalea sp.]|nr:hypothetical protein [Sulfuritalea sp.]